MKNKNKLVIIGTILIALGGVIAILSVLKTIQFRSEGVFIVAIGLIFLGLGNSKRKKEE